MIKKITSISLNKISVKNTMFFWIYFFLFFQISTYAQLSIFSLSVIPLPETCLGNGSLTFNATNVTSGAIITYTVYELPDETTPIAVQTTTFLGGRTSGNYKIIAVQSLGNEQNSQTITVTITSNIVPLNYLIVSTPATCNDGTMTAIVTNGIGSQYEIISGPVIRPLQSIPLFSSLPAGIYEVRVFNNCGDATVITHTLLSLAPNINVGNVSFPQSELPTCNSIVVSNLLTTNPGLTLNYPLTLNYSINIPNGTVQTVSQTVNSGQQDVYEALITIPFFYDQLYSYDLVVSDNCGNTYSSTNNVVNLKFTVSLSAELALCGTYYLSVNSAIFTPNLQIQFTQFPSEFDPVTFNANHPGPFSGSSIDYGSFNNPVPFGTYVIQVTDGCGNTATSETILIDEPSMPSAEIVPNPGCQSNTSEVTITIPRFTIVSAIIIVAPTAYGNTLPDDVSGFINTVDGLVLSNLITGTYTLELIDECGNSYTYTFFVPDLVTSVSSTSWSGCALGKGSVRIRGNSTLLQSVVIISAPTAFSQTLPFNASFNISLDGIFSMGDLFPGTYIFKVVDSCGLEKEVTVTVVGYAITADSFSIIPRCGAFDLSLLHTSNAISELFWLQKFNPITATWENPISGIPFIEGSIPDTSTSLLLQNNFTTLNLTFLGSFRILKSFQTFDNGNISSFKTCIENLRTFDFTGEIQFTGIEKTNCDGQSFDVKLIAIGVPPLNYSIIEKNNLPFFINNGTNNIFIGLEPAIYTFKVEQSCGDSRNFISDISQLPSLAIANQPSDMYSCDDSTKDGIESFILTNQNATVLGSQQASLYTITYHSSLADASLNSNPLSGIYTSGNTTIYCRLHYISSSNCFDITSFNLIVNPYPVLDSIIDLDLCEGETATINAESGFSSYLWSTGETTQSITVNQSGQYTLNVTKTYSSGTCTAQIVYNITESNAPVIQSIETSDWTNDQNSITVSLDGNGLGNYVYSIDAINFQESPFFNNLNSGFYTVYVKDTKNCGTDEEDVFLLNYPHYFTPNGDGIHDYWRVKFSEIEPNMKTYIYDRFGKLITGFSPESAGWDGMLNGQLLPSTDYWFVITRENGKQFKGHFAMKR